MSKKVSTILAANETTTAPANVDFVVDGEFAGLALNVFTLTGTTPTIAVTATELFEKGFTLDYDAQTVNFTVGRTVQGKLSNAKAQIMADTDGGATGTLELKKVAGNFIDNEELEEVGFATPGKAVVNGTLTRVVQEGAVWATIGAGAVDANSQFLNPLIVTGDGDRGRVLPRRFRLKVVEGGTWTAADFAVDLIQSNWGN